MRGFNEEEKKIYKKMLENNSEKVSNNLSEEEIEKIRESVLELRDKIQSEYKEHMRIDKKISEALDEE